MHRPAFVAGLALLILVACAPGAIADGHQGGPGQKGDGPGNQNCADIWGKGPEGGKDGKDWDGYEKASVVVTGEVLEFSAGQGECKNNSVVLAHDYAKKPETYFALIRVSCVHKGLLSCRKHHNMPQGWDSYQQQMGGYKHNQNNHSKHEKHHECGKCKPGKECEILVTFAKDKSPPCGLMKGENYTFYLQEKYNGCSGNYLAAFEKPRSVHRPLYDGAQGCQYWPILGNDLQAWFNGTCQEPEKCEKEDPHHQGYEQQGQEGQQGQEYQMKEQEQEDAKYWKVIKRCPGTFMFGDVITAKEACCPIKLRKDGFAVNWEEVVVVVQEDQKQKP